MSHTSHHESQRAASVSPINSEETSSLFPPYYLERSPSPSRTNSPEVVQKTQSQASNKNSTQLVTQNLVGDDEDGLVPKERSIWRKLSSFFLLGLPRSWLIEYVSSFISIAAFVSIVVVLHQYDQKSMPSWPLDITLNTLLALLTAVSQTCFVYPVVQGLSQMKWNWFTGRERPLVDFENFDNASRGAWGSMLLVFSTKGRLSVLLAAIILVTSAVTSTITQAALTQGTKYVAGDGNATVNLIMNDKDLQMSTVNDAMAVMLNAMYTPVNFTYDYTTPECSTGNCQWPTFGSLAVCSQMNDITDQLHTLTVEQQCCWQNTTTANKWDGSTWGAEVCQNCTYSALPNGFYLNYLGPGNIANTSSILLSSDTNATKAWSKVYSFENETYGINALNAVQVVYLDSANETYYNSTLGLPNSTILLQHSRAVEVLFYLCAQTYDVSTSNGTATTIVNTTLSYVNDTQTVSVTDDDVHYTNYQNHTFILGGRNYSFDFVNLVLGPMLNDFATGSYNGDIVGGGLESMTPFSYAVGNRLYHDGNNNISSSDSTSDEQMRQAMAGMTENMVKGLTNWLRSKGTTIEGEAMVLDVYVIVRWNYLIFLGVQVFLSTAFLVWIVIDSKQRKTKILKESAMAALLSITGSDREYLERQMSIMDDGEKGEKMKEDVERCTRAKFYKDDETGQWNLRFVNQKPEI